MAGNLRFKFSSKGCSKICGCSSASLPFVDIRTLSFGFVQEGTPEKAMADLGTAIEEDPMAMFSGLKKIKKKQKTEAARPEQADEQQQQPEALLPTATDEDAWLQSSDRDYTYQELLSRITKIIRANNPDLVCDAGKKMNMVLPQVAREGTKKSSFSNLMDVCIKLNRPHDHVTAFLLAELGTTGNLDAQNALIIRGRFQQKQIEVVIKRYVQEYVQCKTCKSPVTTVTKENRLYFQRCEKCGASRTVAAIKTGFKAQENRASQRKKLLI